MLSVLSFELSSPVLETLSVLVCCRECIRSTSGFQDMVSVSVHPQGPMFPDTGEEYQTLGSSNTDVR